MTRFARQDQQLTRHVCAGEIVTRIGFGKAHLPRHLSRLRQGDAFIQLAEDKGERARQDAGEAQQLITRVHQVLQVFYHRQTGTDVSIIKEFAARFGRGGTHLLVVVPG